MIYIPKDVSKLSFKDKIKVQAEYTRPEKARNDGEFDYSLYLKTKKIYGSFKVKKVLEIEKSKSIPLINKIQIYIKNIFRKNLKNKNANLAIGLLLGDRSNIEEKVQEYFKTANLSHLLAISGAHFSYVILLVTFKK